MWRTHTEQLLSGQGTRHLQDVGRLQDMLMKMVIAHQPITYQQQIPQTLTTGVSVAKEGFKFCLVTLNVSDLLIRVNSIDHPLIYFPLIVFYFTVSHHLFLSLF